MAVILTHGFETNTNNHVPWFSATVVRDTGDAHTGSASLLVTQTDAFAGVQLDNWPYFSGVTAGNQYDVSLWYREATATMPTVEWEIIFYNESGNPLGSTVVNLTRVTTWTRASTTVTAPTGATRIGWTFDTTTGNGSAWRIDDLVVEDAVTSSEQDLGQAAETETAAAVTRVKSRVLGQAVETTTAAALARAKTLLLGQATQTDTATTLDAAKARTLGVAAETGTATALTRAKTLALGQATETDTASAASRVKARLLAAAVETDTATALSWPQFLTIGVAVETNLARPVTAPAGPAPLPPTDRTLPVTAETRALAVTAENRTAPVLAESRALVVARETRTI